MVLSYFVLVSRATVSTWHEMSEWMSFEPARSRKHIHCVFGAIGRREHIHQSYPFTKRALLLGAPSIININVINSLFSLLESRFRFDTLDFQCLDSHSIKFQDLQLLHILKMETTLNRSSPIHFEVFLGMDRWIQILPRYKHLFSIRVFISFSHKHNNNGI